MCFRCCGEEGYVDRTIFLKSRNTRLLLLNGSTNHRSQDAIATEIRMQLEKLEENDFINFIGYLISIYAVIIPEDLFRKAKVYWSAISFQLH